MRNSVLKFAVIATALLILARGTEYGRPRRQASPKGSEPRVPLGFSPESFKAESRWEKLYLAIPQAKNCDRYLRQLTAQPHVAGTPGDRHVTDLIYDEFKRDGLNPEIVEYKVLLSYPKKISVEVVAPQRIKLANPEPEISGDPDTRPSDPMVAMPWNGYSPSGDLTLPIVYANYGTPVDYDQLEKMGVSVKGKIVLVRYFHGYRGGKSQEAQKRGVAALIVYSDPADDGAKQGPVYPHGPWGPLGHFQRGAVVFDYEVPGDPLTPGWASTDGAKRIRESEAKILPKLPMVPMSAADASQILKQLHGADAPKGWQGGLPLNYHVGDDSTRIHMDLEMENKVTPIWDVIGKIPGRDEPEKTIILGNHHDAWVYGAVDPSSGTATMLETARALGELLKRGFRPRRTIILGSWDAEEYTLTGSTEWGEEHESELKKNAVLCLNVDASTSGQDFTASMVPALVAPVMEATQDVRDPATGKTVYERWREKRLDTNIRSYAVAGSSAAPVPFGILGGGSDFMVFLQHDGVPSVDMIFDGPYGVYHSLYDDYRWMARFGDPGFRYHAAMSRLWGLLALRFANADILPLDYSLYPNEVAGYLKELERFVPSAFAESDIKPLIGKCKQWQDAAERLTAAIAEHRSQPPAAANLVEMSQRGFAEINSSLMAEERALLDPDGIPNRPWFRHVIYAPLPTYDAETLPGLREAIEARDWTKAHNEAARIGRALDRATQAAKVGN